MLSTQGIESYDPFRQPFGGPLSQTKNWRKCPIGKERVKHAPGCAQSNFRTLHAKVPMVIYSIEGKQAYETKIHITLAVHRYCDRGY
jgi:hypothetical protein